MQFQYDIVDNNGIPREQFDDEFFNLIGDILVEVMDEQTQKMNQSIEKTTLTNLITVTKIMQEK